MKIVNRNSLPNYNDYIAKYREMKRASKIATEKKNTIREQEALLICIPKNLKNMWNCLRKFI